MRRQTCSEGPPILGKDLDLTAADGHVFSAYLAEPGRAPRGGVVVLQEFFGVNRHIREMADDYARNGYLAIAPAIFDRVERGVAMAYDEADAQKGRRLRAALAPELTLLDIQATIDAAAQAGPVAALGYCWGGSLAFLAATRLEGLACAIGYYGAQIAVHADERPRVPVLLHFAEHDEYIPPADVERIRQLRPEIPIHSYPGTEHGFNCNERKFFEPRAAALAQERTLTFLARHLHP